MIGLWAKKRELVVIKKKKKKGSNIFFKPGKGGEKNQTSFFGI